MSEVEKKWKRFDSEISNQFRFTEKFPVFEDVCEHSRESYKEALREAIEKYYANVEIKSDDPYTRGLCDAYETVLEELDRVTPKE